MRSKPVHMRKHLALAAQLALLPAVPPVSAGEFDYFEFSAGYAEVDDADGAYVDAYSTALGLVGSAAILDNLAFDYGLLLGRSEIDDFESKSRTFLFGPNIHFGLGRRFELMLRYTALRDETSTRAPGGIDLGSDSDVGESVGIGLRTRLGYVDYVDLDLYRQELYGVSVDGYSLQVVIGNGSSAFVVGFSSAEDTAAGLTSDGVSIAFRTIFD